MNQGNQETEEWLSVPPIPRHLRGDDLVFAGSIPVDEGCSTSNIDCNLVVDNLDQTVYSPNSEQFLLARINVLHSMINVCSQAIQNQDPEERGTSNRKPFSFLPSLRYARHTNYSLEWIDSDPLPKDES